MWDPDRYERFAEERRRPAEELLARVSIPEPGLVVDLGTGTGHLARRMAARWPDATVIGVDTSARMLAEAASVPSTVDWVEADIAEWRPPRPVDLLIANASLHWLGAHDRLFPQLVGLLAPGGVLAVQMPMTWWEPSHVLMRETLTAEGLGSATLRSSLATPNVLTPDAYRDIVRPLVARLDIWETRYHHDLDGEDPIVDWVAGAALRPILAELDAADTERFLDAYRRRLCRAYPRNADGTTTYPFPRLFIVAVAPLAET